MAQIHAIKKKGVVLTLNGEVHMLNYDLNSFAELEMVYGNIQQAMLDLEKGSLRAIRAILWAGMLDELLIKNEKGQPTGEYTMTPYDVGGMLSLEDLPNIAEKIKMAMDLAMPAATPPVEGAAEVPNA